LFDAHGLLAIAKPAGLAVHPTLDRARPSVLGLLQGWLTAAGDEGRLGLVHRLDADTSGVLLLCREPPLQTALTAAWQTHAVRKTYVALTAAPSSPLPTTWRIDNHLKAKKHGKVERMEVVRAGGDRALTDVRLLAASADAALVEARPLTGRRHQIRVHLATSGLPIRGDSLYGDPSTAPRLMLHALTLRLPPLPGLAEGLVLHAPPPRDLCAATGLWLGDVGRAALDLVAADAPP
jgi:23S rRNA-/tRNA-specific pseudouridylate synthase